jgi:hypothetical protein
MHLTYSELIYIFANETVPAASVIGFKEDHPSGKKLNNEVLAEQLVLAALAYLYDKQYLTIQVVHQTKWFVLKEVQLFVVKNSKNPELPVSPLESKIISHLDIQAIILDNLVKNLIDKPSEDPWMEIIRIVKDSLITRGLLIKAEPKSFIFNSIDYVFPQGLPDLLRKQYLHIMKPLSDFEKLPEFYYIRKCIIKGVSKKLLGKK